jgi:hypothetical protein
MNGVSCYSLAMSNALYCPGSTDVRHADPSNFPTINQIDQFRHSINFVSRCAYQFYWSPTSFSLPITRFSKAVLYSLCHHSKHRVSPTQPHAFHFFRSAKFDPYKWLVPRDVTLSVIYAVNLCLIILTQPIPKVHKIQLPKLLINVLSHKSMVAGKAYYSAFGNSLCT